MIYNVGSGGSSTAEGISYNNDQSGIQSENVQGAIDILNSSLKNTNNERFYFDYKDGKYGFNTDANRGVNTFHPFNSASLVTGEGVNTSSSMLEINTGLAEVHGFVFTFESSTAPTTNFGNSGYIDSLYFRTSNAGGGVSKEPTPTGTATGANWHINIITDGVVKLIPPSVTAANRNCTYKWLAW